MFLLRARRPDRAQAHQLLPSSFPASSHHHAQKPIPDHSREKGFTHPTPNSHPKLPSTPLRNAHTSSAARQPSSSDEAAWRSSLFLLLLLPLLLQNPTPDLSLSDPSVSAVSPTSSPYLSPTLLLSEAETVVSSSSLLLLLQGQLPPSPYKPSSPVHRTDPLVPFLERLLQGLVWVGECGRRGCRRRGGRGAG